MDEIPAASQRLIAAARQLGLPPVELRYFDAGTKTAQDAADAIGCEVAMIVKSLVFMADAEPVLALIPGDLRLDTGKLAMLTGARDVRRASLDEVRSATGFVAGGTPPFGHRTSLPVFADKRLDRFSELWVAGGTPSTVFPISYDDLLSVTGALIADLTE